MRRICQFAFTAATVLAAATGLVAQMPQPVTEKVTMTATIEAIDKSARLVMLKGEKGNVVAVQVGEQMKRFNELKVGDKVSATYTESVAVSVRQPGQPAPRPAPPSRHLRARPAQPLPRRTPSPSPSSASTRRTSR